jgi:hypothetical protein
LVSPIVPKDGLALLLPVILLSQKRVVLIRVVLGQVGRQPVQAIAHARVAGGTAILLDAQHLVVPQEEAERLQAAGVSFAYLFELGGRVMTVPVNG